MAGENDKGVFAGFMRAFGTATDRFGSAPTQPQEPFAKRFSQGMRNLPVAEVPSRMHLNQVVELLRAGELGSTELPSNQVW